MLHKSLSDQSRFHLEVPLAPQQGALFTSTNFPNTGHCLYTHQGMRRVVVNNYAKQANALESVCLDASGQRLLPVLEGLSYIEVRNQEDDSYKTNTMQAPHRIAENYVKDGVMENGKVFKDHFNEQCGVKKGTLLNRMAFHFAVLRFDSCSMLHGNMMVQYDSQMQITRVLSSKIEAHDADFVPIGGVKSNDLDKEGLDRGKDDKGGTGNVPYIKEFTQAKRIVAYFGIDLHLLRSFQLPEEVTEMLFVLALWKIRKFLEVSLRLRSECDLRTVGELQCTSTDFQVPSLEELERILPGLIAQCKPYMAGRTVVHYLNPVPQPKSKGKDKGKGKGKDRDDAENQDNDESNDEEG